MGDLKSNRVTLREKFELEKFRSKVVKSVPEMEPSPSNFDQKQKATNIEEIIKHMKHLPSFLETGKPSQDQALSFGVMDWARLEKWQNRNYKLNVVRNAKCSPSSSYSSLFSGDTSSPRSSRDRSCSPVRQKVHRATLQSHFKASPKEDFNPHIKSCSESVQSFQYLKDPVKQSCLKGKLKIQYASVNDSNNNQNSSAFQSEAIKIINLQRKLDFSRNQNKTPERRSSKSRSLSPLRRFSFSLTSATERADSPVSQISNKDSNRAHSSPLRRLLDPIFPSKETCHEDSRTKAKVKLDFENEIRVENGASLSWKQVRQDPSSDKDSNRSHSSPLRRLLDPVFPLKETSHEASRTKAKMKPDFENEIKVENGASSSSSRKQVRQDPSSDNNSNRSHSSPLRRLLDPIFPSKETFHEDSRTKAKTNLDFENEIRVEDGLSSSWKQGLFQTTVKNDRLLFTFAVENKKEILAATVKDNNKNSLYTFFTVHEVKKKNISWLSPSQGNKSKDHGYVPNVTAQMKVSNSRFDMREFVLFSVNPNIQPQEELEAVVVKLPRKANGEDNQESFSTTVILPGGSHGLPNKGEPSPLVDRWRSGGVCDCGGWDVGCRLRTLSNQVQSGGSRSDEIHMNICQFELYVQGEFQNKRPFFILSPLKEGIFSIDYNASLSPLQAFAICISYVESRKLTQHAQLKTNSPQQAPRIYTPIPRIKRSVTGKVTSI